jgi:hypothetical protein
MVAPAVVDTTIRGYIRLPGCSRPGTSGSKSSVVRSSWPVRSGRGSSQRLRRRGEPEMTDLLPLLPSSH